jgi:hypothetical protein
VKLTVLELRTYIRDIIESKDIDSGEFDVDDNVLFGKYKNKKGKIKKVFKDDKDHVTIEIEPTPKGRKKNVEMGLYKVWPGEKE